MISAEEAVLEREGYAIRLAGLYDKWVVDQIIDIYIYEWIPITYKCLFVYVSYRGPHTYWLKNGTIAGSPDTCINMLHYEDAASATIACLEVDDSKLTGAVTGLI